MNYAIRAASEGRWCWFRSVFKSLYTLLHINYIFHLQLSHHVMKVKAKPREQRNTFPQVIYLEMKNITQSPSSDTELAHTPESIWYTPWILIWQCTQFWSIISIPFSQSFDHQLNEQSIYCRSGTEMLEDPSLTVP